MNVEIKDGFKANLKYLKPEQIPADFAANKGQWLVEAAHEHTGAGTMQYALIHADDGVLWTKVEGNQLALPSEDGETKWTPKLRTATIQQCRVFGEDGELFIWREAEGQWRGRIVKHEAGAGHYLEEQHILYGSRLHDSQIASSGFSPIFEPTTGIRQIVPISATGLTDDKRITLTVVNYLDRDEDHQARIFCSRLKTINTPPQV